MKFKRSIVGLCVILLVFMLCGCSLFNKTPNDPSDTNTPSIEEPDKTPDDDTDKDTDEDSDDDPDKDSDKDTDKEPDKDPDDDPETPTDCGKFDESDFLKTNGTKVKNQKNEDIYLRGTNAGGLFVTEHWMTGFQNGKTDSDDYKSLTKKFIERFGEERTKQLWAEYRANWWTEQDFANCAEMGMTVIRLPFTYMNVDFAAITSYDNAGKSYDFSALDEFVTTAAQYGLYTILDLHGAYGSQNGQDHSGECKDANAVDFYSNEQMQTLTVKLWTALSEHYKNNPAVAGYDILNEPGERKNEGGVQSTTTRHFVVFDKIYDAIRANGDEHIIMIESCWDGWNLPKPSQYGWTNCIYSFHHYVGDDPTVDEHVSNWQNKLSSIADQNFGLPLQMGEFTAYGSLEKWEKTLALLNDSDWHWTSWTYKIWGNSAWGIVNISGNNGDKVNAATDSYDNIVAKFKKLRTENGTKYRFNGEVVTLESAIKYSLTGEMDDPYIKIGKVGLMRVGSKPYAVFSGSYCGYTEAELASYVIDGEISGRVKLNVEVVEFDAENRRFTLRADVSVFSGNGSYWMHAGFESKPANLPAASATIDATANTVTVSGKTYTLGEASGCRQIVVTSTPDEPDTPERVEPSISINKVGLAVEDDKPYAVFSGACTLNNVNELLSYVIDGEINGRIKLTLEVVSYDAENGTFTVRADISVFNGNGRYYMHAGFESNPANLPAASALIDDTAFTVTVGGKTYTLGEEWSCRQIVVANA